MPPALDTLVVMAFTACKALSPAVRAKRVTVELSRGEEGLAFESVSANKKGLDNPLMPDPAPRLRRRGETLRAMFAPLPEFGEGLGVGSKEMSARC